LAHTSTDYYTKLEQRRGARPSPEVALSLAPAANTVNAGASHRKPQLPLYTSVPTARRLSDG
jgi:hypothetical protein